MEKQGKPLENIRHPSPRQDVKLWAGLSKVRTEDYVFGFESMVQLKAWFHDSGLLKALGRAGLVIRAYTVTNYFLGTSQAVFAKRDHVRGNRLETIEIC